MNWDARPQVVKGGIGESILDAYLKSKGVIPYQPVFNGPHPFDRLCATLDKKRIFIVEAKTKPRRKWYPDTGINLRHYDDYMHILETYSIDVWLTFIDEEMAQIYGNFLSVLNQEVLVEDRGRLLVYPLRQRGIIYFPVLSMTKMAPLNSDQVNHLKAVSTKNPDYL